MKILDVRYIGRSKDRGRGGERSAMGWVDGAWAAIFPESVLREWFCDAPTPGESSNLYAVLGLKQDATADEIKKGFRRMALQWHPDRNADPDAVNQFIKVQEAYNILNDTVKRAKYNAGLVLQASIQVTARTETPDPYGYRCPLKCGLLMVDGSQSGRWYVISKIYGWEDIVRAGQTLVSAWPPGATEPLERWVL